MFKVGDKVTWVSQAGGGMTAKVGMVEAVVPPHTPVVSVQLGVPAISQLTRMFDMGARDYESYLVTVKTGKTDKAAPKLYWPRVSALRKAE